MIITGSIIGGISFGIQAFNAWCNEKNAHKMQEVQEAFQRAALAQNLEEAQRQYEVLIRTKKEIQKEEQVSQLKMMRELHQENIRSIAYLTSLDKWPLAVLPLVMRDENLFFLTDEDVSVVPINIIIGPCRDRNFQTRIWKLVEDELATRFSIFWNTTSSHPITIYQDAWKDDRELADSTNCANIHAKIPNTPTLVISPSITRIGLQIDLTHWCIDGANKSHSFKKEVRLSMAECCHKYTREEIFEEEQIPSHITELADLLESFIGFLDDQYMWLRYNILPQLPLAFQERISINEEGRQLFYRQYVDMLENSLNNGHINIIEDLPLVLSFCLLIDKFGNGRNAFEVVCRKFYGGHMLTDLRGNTPIYKSEKLINFLTFCRDNMSFLNLTSEAYHEIRYGASLTKLIEDSQKCYSQDEKRNSNVLVKKVIFRDDILQRSYSAFCETANEEGRKVITLCRKESAAIENRRNWCRPLYMDKLNTSFVDTSSGMLDEIDRRIEVFLKGIAEDSVLSTWAQQMDDDLVGVIPMSGDAMLEEDTRQIIASARKTIQKFAINNAITISHDYWQKTYLNDSVSRRLLNYCNTVLCGWIDYHFLKEDIIKESLLDEDKQKIETAMTAIYAMFETIASNYIDSIFTNFEVKEDNK